MHPKVLHVIARMNVGGTSKYICTLLENTPNSYLATGFTQGMEIEDSGVIKFNPIRIKSLGRKISLFKDLRSLFELKEIIKDLKPDIVHSHTFKAGLICRLLSGNFIKVHTFHGHLFDDDSFSKFNKILIRVTEKFLATRTNLLISVGKKVGEELRELGIGRKMNWISIPPGVKPLKLINKELARKTLKLEQKGLLFGWMARVTKVKNP
jgi:hypothetical protein